MYFSLFVVVQRALNTIIKCIVANTLYGVRDFHTRQACAIRERGVADGY